YQGTVYVFTASNGTWSQQTTLSGGDFEQLGFSLSLSTDGTTALIGAPAVGNDGAAYLYKDTAGHWALEPGGTFVGDCTATCNGPNGTGENGYGGFGWSVALAGNGETLAVGAPTDNDFTGAVWVFALN